MRTISGKKKLEGILTLGMQKSWSVVDDNGVRDVKEKPTTFLHFWILTEVVDCMCGKGIISPKTSMATF